MTDRKLYLGLIGLAGLTLAACQSPYADGPGEIGQKPAPSFPVRPGETAPAAQPAPQVSADPNPPAPGYEPPPAAASNPGPIVAQALPPPTPAAQQPSAQPIAPPQPEMVTETRTVTTGQVVNVDGPGESYTVKAGDTLYSISRKMDLSVSRMAELNGLKEPYTIRPGQKLKGKPTSAKAYVVQSGDTLSGIGRRFSVSAAQIAGANDTEVGATIRPGQRLVLPTGYRDLGPQQVTVTVARAATVPVPPPVASPPPAPVVAAAPAVASRPPPPPIVQTPTAARPATTPPAASRPATPPPAQTAAAPPAAPRPSTPSIIPTAPASTPSEIGALGRGKFAWPLNGRQLSGFGSRGNNQQSNGLSIAASSGTAVRAAGPGQVMYAGNEVQGFGNLVLIEHADGFVSVYAHLSKIGVTMRQQVNQGQTIGEVGQTGGVTEPQLYFEMRHRPTPRDNHRPFDPTLVLPPR